MKQGLDADFGIIMVCLQFFCSIFCLLISGCIGDYNDTEIQNLSSKLQQLEIAIDKEIQETENLVGLITHDQVQKRSAQSKNIILVLIGYEQFSTENTFWLCQFSKIKIEVNA